MARDVIHSMISSLPTMPALLEKVGFPAQRQRQRIGWLQVAIVLIAGGAHAASMAWPFAVGSALGLSPGQPLGALQVLAGGQAWEAAAPKL